MMPHASNQPEQPVQPTEPEPADELTDRENFDHPNPGDSPKVDKPPEEQPVPEPEPEPVLRTRQTLGTRQIIVARELDQAWKAMPTHHLFNNAGGLHSPPIDRWRNTRLWLCSAVAVAVHVWNQTEDYTDTQAQEALESVIRHFGETTLVHDFYHQHDVAVWAQGFKPKRGKVIAHFGWTPGELVQSVPQVYGGTKAWPTITFSQDAEWEELLKEIQVAD